MRIDRNFTTVPVAVVIALSFFISGCGGSTSSSLAGTVTLTSEANWVAFQDGPSGSWTVVTPDGGTGTTYTLTVTDTDGKYGIAAHRLSTPLNAENMKIIHATRSDATSLSLGLDDTRGTIGATISNYTGSSGIVSTKAVTATITGNALYNLTAYTGTQDAIAVERDGSSVFLRGVSSRDITVVASTTTATALDFSSSDLSKNTTQTFTVTGGTGTVSLHTKNGASANVTEASPAYAYLDGTVSTDMYFFEAKTTGKFISEYYGASSNPGDRTADLTLMNEFTGASMDYSGLAGLSYTKSSTSPAMYGYLIIATQLRTPKNIVHYTLITNSWIGTDTTYSRPSFSGLGGYSTNWDIETPGTLVTANVSAVMLSGISNVDLEGIAQAVAGLVAHLATNNVNFTP